MRNSELLSVTEFTQKLGFSKASHMSLPTARKIFEERLLKSDELSNSELVATYTALGAVQEAEEAIEYLEKAKMCARNAFAQASDCKWLRDNAEV
jgi:hypothetical protein